LQGAPPLGRSFSCHAPLALGHQPRAGRAGARGRGRVMSWGRGRLRGQDRGAQGESGSWMVDAASLLKDAVAVPLLYSCYEAAEWGTPAVPSLLTLPLEVLKQCLLPALDAKALASLAVTCRDLNWAVETAEGVWEELHRRDIPERTNVWNIRG